MRIVPQEPRTLFLLPSQISGGDRMIPGLPFSAYNIIVVSMIPALVPLPGSPWTVLPPGAHAASLEDVAAAFATNAWRRELFDGLAFASGKLRSAGCPAIYLDGSYVTGKPRPGVTSMHAGILLGSIRPSLIPFS